MADDVVLPGTAAIVATDDIGSGRQAQIVKPAFGGDGVATMVSAATPLPTTSPRMVLTGNGTAVGTLIASTDVSEFSSLTISVTGTFTAAYVFEESNDGSTWFTKQVIYPSSAAAFPYGAHTSPGASVNTAMPGGYAPVVMRYFRMRITTYTSGTVSAVVTAANMPPPLVPTYIAGVASGTNGLAVVPNTGIGGSLNDGLASFHWAAVAAFNEGFNGTNFDRHRLPRVFKSVTATASGDTAVWTPVSGKRWQLLRFQLFATGDAAQTTAGVITVTLRDVATSTGLAIPVYVPATGGTGLGGWSSGWIDVGPYGVRAAAANTNLNVNLSAALTAGAIGVVACGTEE